METLCPNKEICGSCKWSHIPYNDQLKQKLADINGSFAIKKVDLECTEIIGAPVTSHYRNRMDFVIDFEGRMGMRQKGKWWRVIDDHTCFISDKKIEAHFKTVRQWTQNTGLTYFDRKGHHGFLRYAVIRSTSLGETMITIVTSTPADTAEKTLAREQLQILAKETKATTVIWSINSTISDVSFGETLETISGEGYIKEKINGFHYHITPNAFFQTNPEGAAILMDTVKEFAGDISGKTIMDLYCGSGFFAIKKAKKAKKVVGVEIIPEAIVDAKVNAKINGLDIEWHDKKTEEFNWMKTNADIVILDPPRSGMHDKALADVIAALPKEIIYISCSYKNFAREMIQLKEHYDVIKMRAIDMFPHTPHVEMITKLKKK